MPNDPVQTLAHTAANTMSHQRSGSKTDRALHYQLVTDETNSIITMERDAEWGAREHATPSAYAADSRSRMERRRTS